MAQFSGVKGSRMRLFFLSFFCGLALSNGRGRTIWFSSDLPSLSLLDTDDLNACMHAGQNTVPVPFQSYYIYPRRSKKRSLIGLIFSFFIQCNDTPSS